MDGGALWHCRFEQLARLVQLALIRREVESEPNENAQNLVSALSIAIEWKVSQSTLYL
jgi:hypothetical protein